MQSILSCYRRRNRVRKMGAAVLLLALIGLIVLPSLLERPNEPPVQMASFEPARSNLAMREKQSAND